MINLLTEKRDKALTQRWGIWLTKRDPERGLKVSERPVFPRVKCHRVVLASDAPRHWQTKGET